MGKIEITPEQMEVVQEYFDGKVGMFIATEHQMAILSDIIDKAEALIDELDAYNELKGNWDLIRWYVNKYQSQE